jgi:hypothetical protein
MYTVTIAVDLAKNVPEIAVAERARRSSLNILTITMDRKEARSRWRVLTARHWCAKRKRYSGHPGPARCRLRGAFGI